MHSQARIAKMFLNLLDLQQNQPPNSQHKFRQRLQTMKTSNISVEKQAVLANCFHLCYPQTSKCLEV